LNISLITCTLNSSTYLTEMIESVKSQTSAPLEHIFVDGGSTDSTLELIEKYREISSFPVSVIQAQPRGIGNAMNVGARHSAGDYLIFLHSDDRLHSQESLALAAIEMHQENPWIIGNCKYINERGDFIGDAPLLPRPVEAIYKTNFVSHPSTFLRREVFIELGGFDESFKVAMDYQLWLRLVSRNIQPRQIIDFISDFRIHQGGTSTSGRGQMILEDLKARLGFSPNFRTKVFAVLVYLAERLYLIFPWSRSLIRFAGSMIAKKS